MTDEEMHSLLSQKAYDIKMHMRSEDVCEIANRFRELCNIASVPGPVRHGRLRSLREECDGAIAFQCSVCGDIQEFVPNCLGVPIWRYCPNCGSRLDGASE